MRRPKAAPPARFVALLLALGALAPGLSPAVRAADVPSLTVCSTCQFTTVAEAIAGAPDGARIEVRGGVYAEHLVIDRPIELIGIDNPVIDGGDQGTIVQIANAAVTIQGFTIRGTGNSHDHEDSAVLVDKGRLTLVGNRIEDALFGVYLKEAHGSLIRDNVVVNKAVDIALRGDSIRVWSSDDVVIENNVAAHGRDTILWYSIRALVRGNVFDHGRYGLHLMYSDDARIESNSLRDNSIGLYIMYSRQPFVRGNSLSDNNHGPTGGGLGLKDVDNAVIEDNRFINNQYAAQVDTSPREIGATTTFRGNVFAYNEIGIGFLAAEHDNIVTENSFVDNLQHIAVLGGVELKSITWSVDGRGNYWSDYVGYDANGDGVGDVPYRSQHLFESLMDDHPSLRLFIFSPAAMAIDFAAKAFPSMRPRVKFTDDAPLMSPPATASLPPVERAPGWQRLLGGGAGVLTALGVLAAVVTLRRRPGRARATTEEGEPAHVPVTDTAPKDTPMTPATFVSVDGVTKRYGKVAAVSEMSFQVAPGEAVALWGPNGAGKTTILRCLLGLARYEGSIRIDGIDPRKDGRAARRLIGYVPQELAVAAMTVGEMATFIARLKGVTQDAATGELERLGIGDQLDKPVAALSGGMRQRLALALALIGAPRVLLLDEPTANLDAKGRAELLGLLRAFKAEGMTLVFSSHRPDDVLTLADRILIVKSGILEAEQAPARFANEIDGAARLVVTLANGHYKEALATLARLGVSVSGEGKVLSVAIPAREKARVISALVLEGVEIADFDMEHGSAVSGHQAAPITEVEQGSWVSKQ
jgi:nitrous oxidase accessory protein